MKKKNIFSFEFENKSTQNILFFPIQLLHVSKLSLNITKCPLYDSNLRRLKISFNHKIWPTFSAKHTFSVHVPTKMNRNIVIPKSNLLKSKINRFRILEDTPIAHLSHKEFSESQFIHSMDFKQPCCSCYCCYNTTHLWLTVISDNLYSKYGDFVVEMQNVKCHVSFDNNQSHYSL